MFVSVSVFSIYLMIYFDGESSSYLNQMRNNQSRMTGRYCLSPGLRNPDFRRKATLPYNQMFD